MNNSKPSYISQVKKVKGGKVSVEISSFKDSGKSSMLAVFNEGDDRFSASKPRRAWLVGTPLGLANNLPQIAEHINKCADDATPIGFEIGRIKGDKSTDEANLGHAVAIGDVHLNVQIDEATAPLNDYQAKNPDKGQKINPSTKQVMTHGGLPIYSTTSVAFGEAQDTVLEADKVVEAVASEASTLAQAQVE